MEGPSDIFSMSSSPKIVIRKFACFENVEISINAFSVFIGPQASGKSLLVKLIYYFQAVCSEFVELSLDAENKPALIRTLQERFTKYFPPTTCGTREFDIRFELGSEWIAVKGVSSGKRKTNRPLSVKVTFSDFFSQTFSQSRMHLGWTMNRVAEGHDEEYRIFEQRWKRRAESLRSLSAATDISIPTRQIFIPAGRSFFALLDKNIYKFLQGANSLDPFFGLFGASYDVARARRSPALMRQIEEGAGSTILAAFDELVRKILKGNVVQRRDKTFITVDHDREVPLEIGSSGQQEAVPMVTVLRNALVSILRNSEKADADGDVPTIFFEEPEAHLFPLAQKDVVDLLVLVFAVSLGRARFIITTHSPYVLAAINVAVQRASSNPDAATSLDSIRALLKKNKRPPLNWNAVAAFSVEPGIVTPILDNAATVIDGSVIDRASDAIYEEMNSELR